MIRFLLVLVTLFTSINCVSAQKTYLQENAKQFNSEDLPDSFIRESLTKKVILFGEQHGTEDFPVFFGRIVSELSLQKPLVVALEFPSDIQNDIDRFINTGDDKILKQIEFFQDSKYHSGRGSFAMVELLKKLRGLNNIEVFCFDVPKGYSGSGRDTKMAMNLWNKIKVSNKDVVALTGNIHSRLTVGVPWDSAYPTMGSELIRVSSGNITLDNSDNYIFRIGFGKAWMCVSLGGGNTKCDEFKTGSPSSPYATEVDYDNYVVTEEQMTDGHKNSIFFRKTEASFPFK